MQYFTSLLTVPVTHTQKKMHWEKKKKERDQSRDQFRVFLRLFKHSVPYVNANSPYYIHKNIYIKASWDCPEIKNKKNRTSNQRRVRFRLCLRLFKHAAPYVSANSPYYIHKIRRFLRHCPGKKKTERDTKGEISSGFFFTYSNIQYLTSVLSPSYTHKKNNLLRHWYG